MLYKKEIIILIGNIGSGKSTYSKKYQEKGYVIIARDQLRYGIGNGTYVFNRNYEPIIWSTEHYMFKYFLNLGVNLVIDEISINQKMRERYIPYAKSLGYKIIAIEMPNFNKKDAIKRRMTNPHNQYDSKLWEQIWTKFNALYEAPTKEEGFDKIIKVSKNEVI